MHRSASWSRSSDDYFKHATNSPSPEHRSYSMFDGGSLLTYDTVAELAKRERALVKFAENAVHFIPLVLLVCAIILWLFSNPGEWHRITCMLSWQFISWNILYISMSFKAKFFLVVNLLYIIILFFGDLNSKILRRSSWWSQHVQESILAEFNIK